MWVEYTLYAQSSVGQGTEALGSHRTCPGSAGTSPLLTAADARLVMPPTVVWCRLQSDLGAVSKLLGLWGARRQPWWRSSRGRASHGQVGSAFSLATVLTPGVWSSAWGFCIRFYWKSPAVEEKV